MREEKIRVLIVEPHKEAREEYIDNTLEAMQEIVGGYIEVLTLLYPGEVRSVLICNEEGKLLNLEENRVVFFSNPWITRDNIRGTFIICGEFEDEFCSLEGDAFYSARRMCEVNMLPNPISRVC